MCSNEREIETFVATTTPDFEWTTSMMAVENEVFWGRERIDQYFERMREAWLDVRAFGDEYRDLGDPVLFLGRLEGRGRASGVPVRTPLAALSDPRRGEVSRMRSYLDQGEAMRAAGLEA
jgi:ketosteroid isomerase-like protein